MGIDVNNNPVRIRSGRYGKYLEVGLRKDKTHKVYSLPKWIPATVTLEQVLEFASLPRVIGVHTDPLLESAHVIVDISGGQVSVGVEGYPLRVPISRDGTYPSEVSFDEALLLLPDARDILSSITRLGVMNDIPVTIEKGRWGYYLRCGDIISRLPKISKDEVTIEIAIDCLNTFGKKIGSKKRSKKTKEEVAVARKEKRRLEKEEKKRIQQEKTEANTAKRAPGPFIVFCSQMRSEIVTANPGAEFGTIAKQLGKMWKELSDEEKATFGNRN
jgi:topoisomerase IA-like protein